MKTSRQRVLDYIQMHRAVTTAELCQALNSSEANMRHHLSILQQQGLVQVIDSRAAQHRTGGRGRPARVFGPVDPSPVANLADLAAALLSEILPGLSADEREVFLKRVAGRLADGLLGSADTRLQQAHEHLHSDTLHPERAARPRRDSLTVRLFSAIERLNRAHYQARWEARPDAPRIILGHCPFGDLPLRHPEVCQLDARLLETLARTPVEQLERLEKDARGLRYCLFRLLT